MSVFNKAIYPLSNERGLLNALYSKYIIYLTNAACLDFKKDFFPIFRLYNTNLITLNFKNISVHRVRKIFPKIEKNPKL